jgi:hypothetical protein
MERKAWESLEGQEEKARLLVPSIETSQRIESWMKPR